jgi:hypothetical protein
MQRALLNPAIMRVAETTEVSGRVTVESLDPGFCIFCVTSRITERPEGTSQREKPETAKNKPETKP